MLRKFLIILFIIMLFNNYGYSQEKNATVDTFKSQILVLEEKIDNLENENMKDTANIRWGFGISVTVIIFMLGSFGLFTIKISERELKAIKMELKNQNNSYYQKLEEEIQGREKEYEEKAKSKIEEIESDIEKSIDNKLSTIEESIKSLRVDVIRERIKGKNRVSMYTYRKIIEDAAGIFQGVYIIPEILNNIEKQLSDEFNIDSYEETELNYLLEAIPKEFSNQKRRIELILRGEK